MPFRPTFDPGPARSPRALATAALAAVLLLPAAGARAQGTPAAAAPADKLVLVSTSDVKGKTTPCGCSIPKGGLSRRAGFTDSLRKVHPNVLLVDAGGFFPDAKGERDDAPFMTEAMHDLGIAAAGLGDRELMFGRAFLLAALERAPVPVTCANLWDKTPGQPRRPLAKPSLLVKAGKQKVGFFGLIAPTASLGPSADSLETSDPAEAATKAVAELRKQGANVIVLLSSLGRIETEDLVVAVPGIDVAIAGRNVPLLQRSREIDNTTVVFGGEQGQYVGVTELGLDAKGRIVSRTSGAWMLGPDVADQPAMLAKVTAFEEQPSVKARRVPAKPAAGARAADDHAGHSH